MAQHPRAVDHFARKDAPNVIDSYLDTLFSPSRHRPLRKHAGAARHDEDRSSLLADGLTESQAVGRVIAEFGSLEVATELGSMRSWGSSTTATAARHHGPVLGTDRARAYVQAVRRTQWLLRPRCPCSCSARSRCC